MSEPKLCAGWGRLMEEKNQLQTKNKLENLLDAGQTQSRASKTSTFPSLSVSSFLSLPSLSPTAIPLCKVSRETLLADRGERGQRNFGFAGAETKGEKSQIDRFHRQRCAALFVIHDLSFLPFLSSISQQAISCSEL